RYFARYALGQPVTRIRVLDARILGCRSLRPLVGRSFLRVHRHGKHLFADAEGVWLRLHFGMTGDLAYYRDDPPRFARVIFDFDSGAHLAYKDARLFGVVDIVRSPEDFITEYGLGPDPLDPRFTLRDFRKLLHKRRGRIKALMLSQDIIAGIGNLYADEALFRSSIDPRRTVDRISDAEVKALYKQIRAVLRETIDFKSRDRDYPARFLIQHREEGDRCPRCGGTIHRTVVATRTTYYCAKHQT
ncbi:MAG TPA: DNA-formamidopyrimidine glycosylase family protein, partial [Thermoanaerobaculia bacterium]